MAVIAGCTRSTENLPTSPPVTPALPVSSASPTATTTLTLIPPSTHTPTPVFTPTAVPTLPTEEAYNKLWGLLANNGGCRLPCLWGITPGRSTNQEARNILMPLSGIGIPERTYFGSTRLNGVSLGTISPLYVEGEQHFSIWLAYLYNDDGIVNSIGFRALKEQVTTDFYGNWTSRRPIFDSTTYAKRIEYYSLFHVLSEQGIPASVMIYASGLSGYPVVAGGIKIALLYPDQGIWVNYTMPMYTQEGGRKGCPANAHVEMELYPPGNPGSFFSLLDQSDWGRTKSGYRLLEEATFMSVEEFYETFRNPTDECIEIPASLWPTPDPGGG
jgi:hypothetical protein